MTNSSWTIHVPLTRSVPACMKNTGLSRSKRSRNPLSQRRKRAQFRVKNTSKKRKRPLCNPAVLSLKTCPVQLVTPPVPISKRMHLSTRQVPASRSENRKPASQLTTQAPATTIICMTAWSINTLIHRVLLCSSRRISHCKKVSISHESKASCKEIRKRWLLIDLHALSSSMTTN